MSSQVETFECRWTPSRRLRFSSIGALILALLAPWMADVPLSVALLIDFACLSYAAWCLPLRVSLRAPRAWCGVRHDARGWQLWNRRDGWQAVQLLPQSVVLPWAVVMRFRLPGRLLAESVCVMADALPVEAHRRLRVRLRFSRQRWRAPE